MVDSIWIGGTLLKIKSLQRRVKLSSWTSISPW
jgi:hypothetical protein